MSRQITIIYPDHVDTFSFTIEFSDDYGEVFNVEEADTLKEALELIEKIVLIGNEPADEE